MAARALADGYVVAFEDTRGRGDSGGLTLTGIGGLISFAIGAAGFGAVLEDYFG